MAAIEEGTYVITARFTDENGAAEIPTAITWSLLDLDGNVINSRNKVVIAAPATTVTVVLSGNDLSLTASDSRDRRFLVEATYTSTLGAGLPLKKEYNFSIDGLVGVT
jgi:hypothetical protein